MDSAQTISAYLSSEHRYHWLFWTSYTVDPLILEFLFKNDLNALLSRPYFHFICDKAKLDEAAERCVDDPKALARLASLQTYACISDERLDGAFHPKLLFMASEERIRCIVLSGNATSAGIMSNQDLIARFDWERNGDQRFRGHLGSIYQYLLSFQGWQKESRVELENLGREVHPWLMDVSSEQVMHTRPERSLLDQIVENVPDTEAVDQIFIFSPFLDPELRALREIANVFPNSRLSLTYSGEVLEVKDPAVELPCNVQLFSSRSIHKQRFHAKYYALLAGGEGLAFWGSPNCSYSALLSLDRNQEILIQQKVTLDEVLKLWPGLNTDTAEQVRFEKVQEPVSSDKPRFEILSGRIHDDAIELSVDSDPTEITVHLILDNGKYVLIENQAVNEGKLTVETQAAPKTCTVYLALPNGERVSNVCYLNNPKKLAAAIEGDRQQDSYQKAKQEGKDPLGVLSREYFVLNPPKKSRLASAKSDGSTDPFAFWKMPEYRRHSAASSFHGIRDLGTVLSNRIRKKGDRDNTEGNNSQSEELRQRFGTNNYNFETLSKHLGRIRNALVAASSNRSQFDRIPFARWLEGASLCLQEVFERLEQEEMLEEVELKHLRLGLSDLLHVTLLSMEQVNDENIEDYEAFLSWVHFAISTYLLIALYAWQRMALEVGKLSTNDAYYLTRKSVADALLLKATAENHFPLVEVDTLKELRDSILQDIVSKFYNAKAVNLASQSAQSAKLSSIEEELGEMQTDDIVLIKNTAYRFEHETQGGLIEVSDLLGKTKKLHKDYVDATVVYSLARLL